MNGDRDLRPRVVSLVPSATETLLRLGADVVACTRFCNQPGMTIVGGTKNPDMAAVAGLRPDVVVVDTEENRRQDAEALRAAGLTVEVTSVRSVDDALAVVGQLARAAGVASPEALNPPLSRRSEAPRRRCFVPIWRRPWMTFNGDTYAASLLASIGLDIVTSGCADRYPTVDLADIADLAPDMVLVPSEPYSFTDVHVADLASALPAANVLRVDGEDLFWWGARTPEAQRRLATRLDRV